MLNRYIVMLNNNASCSDIEKVITGIGSAGGEVAHRYYQSFKGFYATIPENHLRVLQDLRKTGDSKITHIEPDAVGGIDS